MEQSDGDWILDGGQECRWGSRDPWSCVEKAAAFLKSVTGLHSILLGGEMVKRPALSGIQ